MASSNDATSGRPLTEHDPELAEQSATESRVVDEGAAGDILRDATVETAAKADGRYVIYYSWPDDV